MRDPALRLEFCHWFIQNCKEDQTFLSNLITSDEAIFSLNSEVNTHNVINYSPYGQGHPDGHYIHRQQGAGQVLVWIGLTGDGRILGPHFVNGNLDSREYLRIIRYNVIQREFAALDINQENVWWQQDGAPAHTSNQTMQYLHGRFPGKVISKRGDFLWPPRSPDLAILDFFLWGYLKTKIWDVQRNMQPTTIDQLKNAIRRQCRDIPRDFILNAFQGMLARCNKCINAQGHHFADE